jgi:hypothetical protein
MVASKGDGLLTLYYISRKISYHIFSSVRTEHSHFSQTVSLIALHSQV